MEGKEEGGMKRYSVSYGRVVNKQASKTGIKYQYWGRIDDPDKFIKEHTGKDQFGFQIRDSQTGKIIYRE
jgi:hypothetical protein